MNQKKISALFSQSLIAASLVAFATAASAVSTATTTFQVTASVAAQCSVTATDMAFGVVAPLGGDVDQTSTVTVKCTKNSSYTVGLNAGTVSGSTLATRLMANGGDTMQYNLYTNSGRTTVWGNSATAPTWVSGTGAGMGTGQVLTVYGRVPTGQTNLAVGSYSEPTITVTVTY